MIYEFEGKNEKEAVNNAIESLGLSREEIDIEILETKKGFFGGKVKIKVHTSETESEEKKSLTAENDVEKQLVEFVCTLVEKVGISNNVSIVSRDESKVILDIQSENIGILIGRKGKNLDAIQLLANVFVGRISEQYFKVIVDAEDYRQRRQNILVQMARNIAEQVKKSRKSVLLQALNPFERRLIHTTLNDHRNIETISEGDGLYKKIRIFYKESY